MEGGEVCSPVGAELMSLGPEYIDSLSRIILMIQMLTCPLDFKTINELAMDV